MIACVIIATERFARHMWREHAAHLGWNQVLVLSRHNDAWRLRGMRPDPGARIIITEDCGVRNFQEILDEVLRWSSYYQDYDLKWIWHIDEPVTIRTTTGSRDLSHNLRDQAMDQWLTYEQMSATWEEIRWELNARMDEHMMQWLMPSWDMDQATQTYERIRSSMQNLAAAAHYVVDSLGRVSTSFSLQERALQEVELPLIRTNESEITLELDPEARQQVRELLQGEVLGRAEHDAVAGQWLQVRLD